MPAHNTKTIYLPNRIPNLLCVTIDVKNVSAAHALRTTYIPLHHVHITVCTQKKLAGILVFIYSVYMLQSVYLMHANDENTSTFLLNLDLFVDLFIYELCGFCLCMRLFDVCMSVCDLN